MKKVLLKAFKYFYFCGCFFVVLTLHARAYIDPSVVTYVIQAVAGALIACGAAFTILRHKIFKKFKDTKNDKNDNEEAIEFKEED